MFNEKINSERLIKTDTLLYFRLENMNKDNILSI